MIKIYENTCYTKSIVCKVQRLLIVIGVNTIKWMRMFFKRGYELFYYNKDIKERKIRSRGKYIQAVRRTVKIFCFNLSWTIFKEYSKRKVYTYFHKKKYLNQKPSFSNRLKNELKRAIKK